jgi:hypothetical protein
MGFGMGVCLFAALVLAIVAGYSSQAAAQDCCGGSGYWGGGYSGWWGGYPYFANPYYPSDRRIPYFAEFPPVYYSVPVPRTYGYSPFAYPPGVRTPEVEIEPVMVPNPHVTPAEPASAEEPGERTTSLPVEPQPLVVINPYVVEADAELASRR